MCKFIGKSNERILCKLSKSEILRLYSIVHVAMETTKTSHFTCQSKSFISIFFTWQVSACELKPFSCHDLANDIYSQSSKTVFSHLNGMHLQDSSNLIVSTFIHFLIGTDLKTFPVWISCRTMLSNVFLSWYFWSSGAGYSKGG